jgi:protease IV
MKRWFGRFFTSIGVLVVVLAVIGVVVALSSREKVPERTVLLIDFEQQALEAVPQDPLAGLVLSERIIVRELVDALDAAAADDRVKGVIARIGGGHPMAMTQEFRQAVQRFRASGKPAIAFAETLGEVGPGNTGYYLAAAFDEIYLQESGDIGLVGLAANSMFVRGMLDKLELEPRFDHRHEYKNAMNMLTERGFDEAHREATGAIIESMFTLMSSDIAADRGMSAAEFAALVDRGPYLGGEAVDAGLVDGLAYRDEVFARVEELSGGAFETLSPGAYLKIEGGPHEEGTGVALIYGNGGVQRGQSSFDPLSGSVAMGSDTVTRAFRDALADDDVKAILFRVDSPGGSYVASDAIWRMTVKAREAGKPVVVSMGNVAASGGYFVSMASDRIIAQPGTITGSIGVVGGKFLTRDFWEENLGITWDTVQTSANAGMYVGLHDYTEAGWARHQAWLDRVYDDFTGKVARGRGMSREAVHEVAKGRVWTGAQSIENGLVDAVGGFAEAHAAVRELLSLAPDAPLHVKVFPVEKPWFQRLVPGSEPDSAAVAAVRALEQFQPLVKLLQQAGVRGERHALEMPVEIDVR